MRTPPPPGPAGPPSLRQRGNRTAAGPTALAAAAEDWARTRQRCGADAQRTHRMMVDALAAFAAARPNVDDVLKRLDDALASAESAWRQRFAKEALPTTVGDFEPYNVGDDVQTPDEWIAQVRRLVVDLGSMQLLLSSDSRKKYRYSRAHEYSNAVNPLISVRAGVRQRAWDAMATDGPDRAAAAATAVVRGWVPIPAPAFPIGPLGAPLTEDTGLVRGFGPTWVMVGTAGPGAISFRTTRPSTQNGSRLHSLALPPVVRYPVIIDLDRTGGFVCQTPTIVESTVLGLLAALGPGQVRLDVFDPDRLGESANFLYGLGDAAEKVIGRKVRTTAKELAELLVEVEEHITLVTQKYLQGAYRTLTEYNHASGDVAEAYRVLVIYDYPSGFSRDDQYDKEQLQRLEKILTTGRRCGVFVLIVRSHRGAESDRVASVLPQVAGDVDPAAVVAPGLGLDGSTGLLLCGPKGRSDVSVSWSFDPIPALSPQVHQSLLTHIERGLRRAGDLQVTPDRVSELARSGMERAVAKGTGDREPVVAAYEPATWWQGSSAEHVTAVVGRLGATDTARIRLDSQTASSVLIGGRPGSGKSVLLHSLIMSLVQQYGPDEVELYLIDFKEGVEFKQYATARLPQARVVAIESEREFGVAVLEKLADEIIDRGALFRADGSGEQSNVGQYRRRTGRPMSRIVLIIDEFQVLFDRDDKIGSRAAEMLERVLRTGRAFGVHVVLASQTIAGMPALGRHLPNLIPTRVVLQSAEADSRLLLSEENADARMLSRPGEAILNTAGGQKDANQRIQSTYWDPEDRAWVLEQLRRRADGEGRTVVPIVFEGSKGASVDEVPGSTFDPATTTPTATAVSLPLGLSMNLSGPVRADLRREPGTNLLLVIDEPGPLLVGLVVLARAGVRTEVLDFGGTDEDGAARLAAAAAAPSTTVSRRREVRDRLTGVAAEVDERIQLHDYNSPPLVVVIHGLHRAREFDPNGEFDDASESGLLKRIARDGPEVGVHLLVWIDKKASVDRRLSYDALREFGLRVCGPASREDSLALIDSDEAQGLHPGQAVFDDHDQGRHQRVRLFVGPDRQWSSTMLAGTS
ncbi:FtsK/SpoIIIE domain-containing protein [Nakamurella sp.]|uniref:FtsK/SpoIIIE domain-containing protein n=1 Tax=Nakamurella sp. TaxID=1869182 RepID=UPI003B3AC9ED